MCKSVLSILASFVVMIGFAGTTQAQVRSEAEDLMKETKVSYLAKHDDGTSERVIVAYQGYVYHRIWQSGRSSTWDHPIDDRQCHIETKAWVARRAYLVSHSGVNAPVEGYEKIYNASDYTDRGPENAFEALTRHVTCGEVMGNFQQRVERVKTSLINSFDKIVSADDDPSRARLAAMLKAKELTKAP